METHVAINQKEAELRQSGQQAFASGRAVHDCPHPPYTREAELWRRGFANACFGAQMAQS